MEPKPAAIGPRNFLSLAKERDEKKQDQISIDARLELEAPREIFRGNGALAFLELESGVERVVDLFHERDERADVSIAQAGPRIVPFQLLDQPPGIINPDVKLIVSVPQESPGQLAQLARVGPGQAGKLRASA